jgi:hypothetical protein
LDLQPTLLNVSKQLQAKVQLMQPNRLESLTLSIVGCASCTKKRVPRNPFVHRLMVRDAQPTWLPVRDGLFNPSQTFEFRRNVPFTTTPKTLRRGTYPVALRLNRNVFGRVYKTRPAQDTSESDPIDSGKHETALTPSAILQEWVSTAIPSEIKLSF